MKILSFAHATFVSKNFEELNIPTNNALVFSEVADSAVKVNLLRNQVGFHTITLLPWHLPIEHVYYPNKPEESYNPEIRIDTFISSSATIRSSSFSPELFQFISFLCPQAIKISDAKLKINQLSHSLPVTLEFDSQAEKMGEFLDDSGLVSLAFYVDSIDKDLLDYCHAFQFDYSNTDKINLTLGQNSFEIAFVKVQGVNVEIISRVKRSYRS